MIRKWQLLRKPGGCGTAGTGVFRTGLPSKKKPLLSTDIESAFSTCLNPVPPEIMNKGKPVMIRVPLTLTLLSSVVSFPPWQDLEM